MNHSQEKATQALIELGDPAERQTRTELLDRALRTALILLDADAAVIQTSSSRRGERLALHAGSSVPATLRPHPEGSEVVRSLIEAWQPVMLDDLSDAPPIATADGCPGVDPGPVLFTPLRQRNLAPAYVALYRRRGRARFTLNDCRLMLLVAAWLSAALENLRLSTGVEKLAVTDDLTEVYNSRFLKSALHRELRRASRFGHELSVALIDIDNLKTYNDQHGELRGSLLLREVASVLAQQVRSFDVLARHREDSFLLILPETGCDGAVEVSERARAAVERQAFSLSAAGDVTVSLGVAAFPRDAANLRDFLAAADRALARAKQRGRNCVATLVRQSADGAIKRLTG